MTYNNVWSYAVSLLRLYTTLAYDSKDVEEQLKLLTQAYTVASDGDELLQKAKCGLNLANKYEETGDSDTAVVVSQWYFAVPLFK